MGDKITSGPFPREDRGRLREEPVVADLDRDTSEVRVEDGVLAARPNALFPLLARQMRLAIGARDPPLAVDQHGGVVDDLAGALREAGHDPDTVVLRGLAQPLGRRPRNRLGDVLQRGIRPDPGDGFAEADDVQAELPGRIDLLAPELQIVLGRALPGPQVHGADLDLAGSGSAAACMLTCFHSTEPVPGHFTSRVIRATSAPSGAVNTSENRATPLSTAGPRTIMPAGWSGLSPLSQCTRTITERNGDSIPLNSQTAETRYAWPDRMPLTS